MGKAATIFVGSFSINATVGGKGVKSTNKNVSLLIDPVKKTVTVSIKGVKMTNAFAEMGVMGETKSIGDAINEAFRDWMTSVETTHYCLGSVMGPHPYPWMVREFHRVIGDEAREQCRALLGAVCAALDSDDNRARLAPSA